MHAIETWPPRQNFAAEVVNRKIVDEQMKGSANAVR
jgi:hypothetical protein